MSGFWVVMVVGFAFGCYENADCGGNEVCRDGECGRKGVFPLNGLEGLGTCLVFVYSGLAGAAGIGGASLFVVFYVTLFAFNSSEAVALSHFTVVGCAVMASLIKLFVRHPTQLKPVIDFDTILIIISPLLIGTTVGVIVNISVPYWLILLLLTILLGYLSIGTFRAAIRLYKKESTQVSNSRFIDQEELSVPSEELKNYLAQEKKRIPSDTLLIISIVYFIAVIGTLIKGSSNFSSIIGIEFCSVWFWVFSGFIFVILGFFTYFNSKYIIKKYEKKVQIGYKFDSGDIKWEKNACVKLNIAGFFAGFLGGVIGVGGALVMNPFLIRMNVRPEVMTATTSFTIVFTSTVSALQFLIAGKIRLDYGLWTITFSILGSALGVFVIKGCVDRYRRSSLITFTLAFVMALSGIVTPIYGVLNALNSENIDFGFHNYCKS